MKAYQKISILVAVTGVLLLQAGCQKPAKVAVEPAAEKSEAEPAGGRARIEFESVVYDFGKVGPGQKLSGQFKFTNTGGALLKITGVEKCCGAVTKLDKQELAPGEMGVLQVQYTSGRIAGTMSKRLYVNSNDKATPRAELTIKAETVLKVTYEPKTLRLSLKEENAGCPKITLTSTDNEPFSITRFGSTGNAITADFDGAAKATQFVLQPKVDQGQLRKRSKGYVSIGLAYPEPGEVTIAFEAPSIFTIKPSLLVVFYDKPQQPISKTLSILNNYGEDFEIESTSSKMGYIKVLGRKRIESGYEFDLEITPPPENVEKFTDVFTVNVKGGETRAVACRGIYKASTTKPAGQ